MQVPRMYRAQCKERCQLQYVSETEDRNQWLKEWINPEGNGTVYQHLPESKLEGYHDGIYRIKIKFPYRVFTNSGQDEIQRPPLGKNGIPFISGSSIKGLFRRVCNPQDQLFYCGSSEKPGCLRFHGAYPIGDWTGKARLPVIRSGERLFETCYTILDIAHPQQPKQVEKQETTNANTFISLLKPTLVFEFSNHDNYNDRKIDWEEVKTLLLKALTQGIGGKTSNGYGFFGKPDFVNNSQTINLSLNGSGVSSSLLKGEIDLPKNWNDRQPQGQGKLEFRPNTFKAALRGHVTRLLAGVSNDENLVKQTTNELFGSSDHLGTVQIFWEQPRETQYKNEGKNPTYSTQGNLHLYSPTNQEFIQQILQFAYVMGGFGKTWRRVSHQHFFPSYHQNTLAIGCHWIGKCADFQNINTEKDLTTFLNNLYQSCQRYLSINSPNFVENWREVWHRDRVVVYSQVVTKSEVVELFHDSTFKHTPAIGGRNINDKRPTFISSIWHRMLPIENNQYLEIVTIFHGDRQPWQHTHQGDQLQPFINSIVKKGLQLSWGEKPESNSTQL